MNIKNNFSFLTTTILFSALSISWQNYPASLLRTATPVRPTAATKKVKPVANFADISHSKPLVQNNDSSYNDIKKYFRYLTELVNYAETELKHIPGIAHLMHCINAHKHTTQVKGFWFELEVARHIHKKHHKKKNSETLVAVHYQLRGPEAQHREIDILTNKHCIECKNVRWERATPEDKQRILDQILDQKKLVDWHNAQKLPIEKNYNLSCLLWSAQEIPPDVKAFLRLHKISFIEGLESSLYTPIESPSKKDTMSNKLGDLWNKIFSPLLSQA